MADFLGITKRKWLTFAIFSAIVPAWLLLASWMNRESPFFFAFALAIFVLSLIMMAISDIVLGALIAGLKIHMQKRHLAAILLALSILAVGIVDYYTYKPPLGGLVRPYNPMTRLVDMTGIAGIALVTALFALLAYTISDFLAGLVFPAVAAKTKSNKKKSKN